MKTNKTFLCPVCGGTVLASAKACPQCGSDEQTGWSNKTYLDGLDIGEEVDYDAILENEFPSHHKKPSIKLSWIAIVAIGLLFVSIGGIIKMLGHWPF